MKRSTDRILTTHTGSLPRPPDLLEMIEAKENGRPYDVVAFDERVRMAVAQVVKDQVDAGIDIVSDGEQGKPSFATYVKNRLSGFGGANSEIRVFADRRDFPEWSATTKLSSLATAARPMCTEPLGWLDRAAFETDIRNLQSAVQGAKPEEAFIPSASLGIIAEIMANRYYDSEREYLYALADVMKEEYEAIANAGFVLQIDAPDAAMGRHSQFWDSPLEDFRASLELRVEALNHALADIPEEQIRFHICWGNYEGPHNHDVPLKDIVDIVLKVNAGAYSVEASNPRHAHEWQVWEDVKLPDGKVLIPGVIDSTTNFIEHPEVVAQRIVRYAELVGRENVIAGTDCGFGTAAGLDKVHPTVMWAKFRTMAEGAELASKKLWG
ncbi:MAG: cobalamin-independent methionine synthase II family protein [Chloroflexi bacterium]|nr:cobalamin-independent methionine synthase II family protein [Chloroflexota bacterium]